MNINKSEFLGLVRAESAARKSTAVLAEKEKLRNELEVEMEKYLARGGQINQVEQKQYEAKHGTNTQYTNMGCRCKKCHAWALKVKKVKTGEIRL